MFALADISARAVRDPVVMYQGLLSVLPDAVLLPHVGGPVLIQK